MSDDRETDFKPDWDRYRDLRVLLGSPGHITELRALLREARADAVRFIEDVKAEELARVKRETISACARELSERLGGSALYRSEAVSLVRSLESRPLIPLTPRLVILESPLAPREGRTFEDNKEYARRCMCDSLKRGESPLASHLLYDQPGILDDMIPDERALGIEAGLAWGRVADATVVYTDHGVSGGMQQGIDRARAEGRPIEMRSLK